LDNGNAIAYVPESRVFHWLRFQKSALALEAIASLPPDGGPEQTQWLVMPKTHDDQPELLGIKTNNDNRTQVDWLALRPEDPPLKLAESSFADLGNSRWKVGLHESPDRVIITSQVFGGGSPSVRILRIELNRTSSTLTFEELGTVPSSPSIQILGSLGTKRRTLVVLEEAAKNNSSLFLFHSETGQRRLLEAAISSALFVPASDGADATIFATLRRDASRSLAILFPEVAVGGLWQLMLPEHNDAPAPMSLALKWKRLSRELFDKVFQLDSSPPIGWHSQDATYGPPDEDIGFLQRLIQTGSAPGQDKEYSTPCLSPFLSDVVLWNRVGLVGITATTQELVMLEADSN
jgi:hypothetical protein